MKGLILLLLIFALAIMLGFFGWCIAEMFHAMNNDDEERNMYYYDKEEYEENR